MRSLTSSEIRHVRPLVGSIVAKRERLAALQQEAAAVQAAARMHKQAREEVKAISWDFNRFAGLCALYRRTDDTTRGAISFAYSDRLRAHREPVFPNGLPTPINFDALPSAARPFFLAPYLGVFVGHEYPRLCLARSYPEAGRLVYMHTGGPADPANWRPHLDKISGWLGGTWTIGPAAGTTLTLTRRPELPSNLPFRSDMLRPGELFTGLDVDTAKPSGIPVAELTSGTLLVGATGTGKSNAMHLLLGSIVANLDQFSHVYLIDGKDGVAFNRYAGKHRKISVLWDEADVWRLTTELVATMRARNHAQREAGIDNATGDFIAVVIDEMSTYTAKPSHDSRSEANRAHARFLDELTMLARRGRSTGLRLILSAQEPTDNQVPTAVRNNCLTTFAFKLPIDAHATAVFGQLDQLPADPRKLVLGQALLRHGLTGKLQLVQFPVVTASRGRP